MARAKRPVLALQSRDQILRSAQLLAENLVVQCHRRTHIITTVRKTYGITEDEAHTAADAAVKALSSERAQNLEEKRALMTSRLEYLYSEALQTEDRIKALTLCERLLRTMAKIQGLEQNRIELQAEVNERPTWLRAMTDEELDAFILQGVIARRLPE